MAPRLKKIQQNSLRDQVIVAIRDAVIQGEFKPGEKIHEQALSELLGVSRTPIREAIAILEQQGLVQIIPKRGTFVARVDLEELKDKLYIRSAMEQLAIRQAVERLNSEQWLNLCEILKHMLLDMKEMVEKGDVIAANELDIKWHKILVDAAQNRHLSRFWIVMGLQDLVWSPERDLYPLTQEKWLDMLYIRHMELLEVLLRKNVDECCRAIDLHIVRKFIDLQNRSNGGPHDGDSKIVDEANAIADHNIDG
jgi:DNA-binding GntR family transcriptional regulator